MTYRSLTQGTSVGVEHLRVDDPRGTVPRRTVESGPQVEEKHGSNTPRAERLAISLSISSEEIATDDPHADRATSSTDHEEIASAKSVDEEQEPDDCNHRLHNPEQASGEECSVCTSNTDGLEDRGRIVVDSIDATAILPQEEHATEEKSPLDRTALSHRLEGSPETQAHG